MRRLVVTVFMVGLLGFVVAQIVSPRPERVVRGTVESVDHGDFLEVPTILERGHYYLEGKRSPDFNIAPKKLIVRMDSGELVGVDGGDVKLPTFVFPRKKCELHLRDRLWSSPVVPSFELK